MGPEAPPPEAQPSAAQPPPVAFAEVERLFRAESGRAVAVLTRVFGDLDLAEESVQEAFRIALDRWPRTGLPPSPPGWILTTARNCGVDRIRRESTRDARQAEATRLAQLADDVAQDRALDEEVNPVEDDQLRLIFTCCHPALAPRRRWHSRCVWWRACGPRRSPVRSS